MDWLVFIDTNIFLDFYRTEGKRQKGLSVLDHLKDNYDRFITSSQVEMEFKKNRQSVIIGAFKHIEKLAHDSKKVLPAFLEEFQEASSLLKAEDPARKCIERLRKRTGRILEDPTQHDDVYKKVQRLFAADTTHNLNRPEKERFEIRTLARKRFDLGYPPRKNSDTSMGDAINWEWIIHCAKDSKRNVVIVSRDSDYGKLFGKQPILNTWLRQEFYDRTSRKHKIHLTERLTDGLKHADIAVSQEEQKQESEFLEHRTPLVLDIGHAFEGMSFSTGITQAVEGIKLQHEQLLEVVKGVADFPISNIFDQLRQDDRDE